MELRALFVLGALMGGSALMTTGCVAAATGAAVGAGTGIFLTSRGAESTIQVPVEQALRAAEQTFTAMNITLTGSERDFEDGEGSLTGRAAERGADVTVEIEETDDGFSKVEVTAKGGMVNWDQEYSRQVLQGIIERAGATGAPPPQS